MGRFHASPFRNRLSSRFAYFIAFVGFALLAASPRQMLAQAKSSADRDDGLSAFATASHVYTDYGHDEYGYTVGGDLTRYMRFLTPSIEARFTHSNDDAVQENSFAGGIKAEKPIRRFHPYADFLVGYGTINFIGGPPTYNHDNSVIYDVGAGVDYRINRMFLVKVDAQQQFWKLGSANHELEPYNVSVGVVYRIPFGLGRSR
jgi:hypothetical protein